MTSEHSEADRSDGDDRLRLSELADLAGLSEAEVLQLVDCGALAPGEGVPGQWVFGLRSLTIARTARAAA